MLPLTTPKQFLGLLLTTALLGACSTAANPDQPTQLQENTSSTARPIPTDGPPLITDQLITDQITNQRLAFYRFATLDEASTILTRDDEYTAEVQAIEIGIKSKDGSKSTLDELKENYDLGVLPWTDKERRALATAVNTIYPKLRAYEQYLPSQVLMAKISDRVEGGLPHTRSNMILFSEGPLNQYFATLKTDPQKANAELTELFLHELHHVMSRHNADRHDDYFALIGFKPCNFTEPEKLRTHRLTNPDAPTYKHYAPVSVEGGNGVIPFLKVSGPYDNDQGGTLGNYFSFGLLPVKVENGTCTTLDDDPTLLSPGAVPDFFTLIGRNTNYIIHPEETLADNFTYLIMERPDLPNPEIPEKIKQFWLGE